MGLIIKSVDNKIEGTDAVYRVLDKTEGQTSSGTAFQLIVGDKTIPGEYTLNINGVGSTKTYSVELTVTGYKSRYDNTPHQFVSQKINNVVPTMLPATVSNASATVSQSGIQFIFRLNQIKQSGTNTSFVFTTNISSNNANNIYNGIFGSTYYAIMCTARVVADWAYEKVRSNETKIEGDTVITEKLTAYGKGTFMDLESYNFKSETVTATSVTTGSMTVNGSLYVEEA